MLQNNHNKLFYIFVGSASKLLLVIFSENVKGGNSITNNDKLFCMFLDNGFVTEYLFSAS